MSEKTSLGIYIRGTPEKKSDSSAEIECVLDFLKVDEKKLVKAQSFGR